MHSTVMISGSYLSLRQAIGIDSATKDQFTLHLNFNPYSRNWFPYTEAHVPYLVCASVSPPYTHIHTHHTRKHWLILQPLLSHFKALFIVSLKMNIQDEVLCRQGQKRQREVPIISKDRSDNKTCLVYSKARTGSDVRFTYSQKEGHTVCVASR